MTPADFIRTHLPLAKVPQVGNIRLHLATPASGLRRLTRATPYWAYVWAGGTVLCRYLQDNPEVVRGLRVLDLGAGSGVVGMVAARAGASVCAAESDPLAQIAIGLNASANAVPVQVLPGIAQLDPVPQVDLILVGDLFYDLDMTTLVLAFLDRAMAQGIDVLVGDPGRVGLPLQRLRPIAQYDVPDFGRMAAAPATVYRLVRQPE